MDEWVVSTFIRGLALGTPLLWAALGEIYAERSGVVNLGVEGMMILGAFSAFALAQTTANPLLGLLIAAGAGAAAALLHAFVTITLRANQYVSGLALTMLGLGLSALLGRRWEGLPLLDTLPEVSAFTYLSLLLAVLLWFVLYHTRWGIVIRSAGEAPAAVDTLGVNVALVRYLAVIFGGALAGGGGGFLSVGFPAALDRGDDQRPGVDRHRHRHLCLLGSPTGGRRRVPLRRALPPLVPPADLGGPGTAADDALCVYDSSIGADGTAWRAGAGRARGAGSAVRAWGEVTGGG